MKKETITLLFLLFTCIFLSCRNTNKTQGNEKETIENAKQPSEQEEKEKAPETAAIIPNHFICYSADNDSNLALSISFDREGRALQAKYRGQKESIDLVFQDEIMHEGGAHPSIETFYTEMYNGKKNGDYKLTHSGIWDYVEYTRGKDGKKFLFTIDHEMTVQGDEFRNTPCF